MQEHWQEKPIDGADGEVERALTSLSPQSPSINRDRLLFSAGYRSAQPKLWMWRGMTGSLAAVLLVSIFIRPQMQPNPLPRTIAITHTRKSIPNDLPAERVRNKWLDAIWISSNQSPQSNQPQNAFSIRQAVLERGIGALPAAAEDASQRTDIQQLLDLRPGEPDHTSIFNMTKPPGQAL